MDENLVGYLLNALEPEQQREVEQYLNKDPTARDKLDVLRRALEPLAADKEPPEPPPGLAFRTLAQVAEYRCRPQPEAPAPPTTLPLQLERRWYRRADILIAASLLILVGGVGVPGLVKLRGEHLKTACANNLRVFSEGFSNYCDSHEQEFPRITDQSRHDRAGTFVPVLREAGVLPAAASTRCPANGGSPHISPHTFRDLEVMTPEQFEQAAKELGGCYAYSLGYKDSEGQCRALRRGETEFNDQYIPIMADKPSLTRGNSPNHHGQNVLYIDGHVEYHDTPYAGVEQPDQTGHRRRDHIYLNRNEKVEAGVDWKDTVLGRSEDRP
jgi:prepilin-type processing-associated H-X9-DG protein